jgi:cytochrome c-type biogenesis protein CcmH/NrfG
VDPSALIFAALAVAWAAYLIPQALRHHEDAVRSRSVDRFSQTMRVLARREPVSRRDARLVVSPGRVPSAPIVTTKHTSTISRARTLEQVSREAMNRAARRRRRVLALLMVSLLATVGIAAYGLVEWWYVAIPAGLLIAWLVACRLMVRGERARRTAPAAAGRDESDAAIDEATDPLEDTVQTAAITDPSLWDPMPVTLPTYVSAPAAERTVRTIDLDSTGVWTSGRTEADAAIARQAEEDDRARRDAARAEQQRRATGS